MDLIHGPGEQQELPAREQGLDRTAAWSTQAGLTQVGRGPSWGSWAAIPSAHHTHWPALHNSNSRGDSKGPESCTPGPPTSPASSPSHRTPMGPRVLNTQATGAQPAHVLRSPCLCTPCPSDCRALSFLVACWGFFFLGTHVAPLQLSTGRMHCCSWEPPACVTHNSSHSEASFSWGYDCPSTRL